MQILDEIAPPQASVPADAPDATATVTASASDAAATTSGTAPTVSAAANEAEPAQPEAATALADAATAAVPDAASAEPDIPIKEGAEAAQPATTDYNTLLEKEVLDLKDKKQLRFRFHDTGIKTLLFLEMPFATKGAGPCEVRRDAR